MNSILTSFKNVFGFAFNQPIYKTLQQMCVLQVTILFIMTGLLSYIVFAVVEEMRNNAIGQVQYDMAAVLISVALTLIPVNKDILKSIVEVMEKNK